MDGLISAQQYVGDCEKPSLVRQPKIREGLESTKRGLEAKLADVNKAIEFLDKHPDYEAFSDIVGKALRY